MKKQIKFANKLIKICGLSVYLIVAILATVKPQSAQAAPTCYNPDYAKFDVCPPVGAYGISYSDGGPTDPNCYLQGTGSQVTIMAPIQCNNAACVSSGGEWVYLGSSLGCACPSGFQLSGLACVSESAVTPPSASAPKNLGIREGSKENDCAAGEGTDLTGENCGIIDLLNTVFSFVSGGVALAVVFNIIVAGIQYSSAQGDPSSVGKAKKRIMDAVLALLMYALVYAFVQWLIPGGVF